MTFALVFSFTASIDIVLNSWHICCATFNTLKGRIQDISTITINFKQNKKNCLVWRLSLFFWSFFFFFYLSRRGGAVVRAESACSVIRVLCCFVLCCVPVACAYMRNPSVSSSEEYRCGSWRSRELCDDAGLLNSRTGLHCWMVIKAIRKEVSDYGEEITPLCAGGKEDTADACLQWLFDVLFLQSSGVGFVYELIVCADKWLWKCNISSFARFQKLLFDLGWTFPAAHAVRGHARWPKLAGADLGAESYEKHCSVYFFSKSRIRYSMVAPQQIT